MAKSVFTIPYIPKAISKQNANSAGYPDPYAPNKLNKKPLKKPPDIFIECPLCNLKVKRLQRHINRVHKEKEGDLDT